MTNMITSRAFNPTNLHVRKVITPDGEGTLAFADADDKNKFYVQVKMPGKKISDFRAYTVEQLQEVEK